MNTKSVGLMRAGFICWLLLDPAEFAAGFDATAKRKPVESNGPPVTAQMFVRMGAPLQAEWNGRWYAAQAIGLLADGSVKIHWVGLDSQSDEVLHRDRLRFADDPLAGQLNQGKSTPGVGKPDIVARPDPSMPGPVATKQPAKSRPARVERAAMAGMTPEQLLEILRAGEAFSRRDALLELKDRRPEKPNPDISIALEELVLGDDFQLACAAAEPWQHWATQESVPGLITALDNKARAVTDPAMQALARLQAEEALEPLVAELAVLAKAEAAAKALKAFGPKAEPVVLDLIKNNKDNFTIGRACKVLAEIGTAKSVPPLMQLQKNFFTQREASAALQTIRVRLASEETKKGK